MSEADTGTVVWTRVFDEAASATRWKRFRLWALLPTAVALAVAFAVGGTGAFLGVLILMGGIVGLWAVLLWFVDVGMRQNAEIRLVDGRLVLGRKEVTVADIVCWTTHRHTRVQRTDGVGRPEALAAFRIPPPEGDPGSDTVAFAWGTMLQHELDSVHTALEPLIEAPWVPLEGLRAYVPPATSAPE